jgi:hypothetical protein
MQPTAWVVISLLFVVHIIMGDIFETISAAFIKLLIVFCSSKASGIKLYGRAL